MDEKTKKREDLNLLFFTYHTNGINLYFTFFLYSVYPSNSFSKNSSSFFIRLAIMKGYAKKIAKEIKEPKISGIDKNNKILVIIGPEGGFENHEIDFFKENNYEMVSISNLIYRAETAAISALSGVIYEYEL